MGPIRTFLFPDLARFTAADLRGPVTVDRSLAIAILREQDQLVVRRGCKVLADLDPLANGRGQVWLLARRGTLGLPSTFARDLEPLCAPGWPFSWTRRRAICGDGS